MNDAYKSSMEVEVYALYDFVCFSRSLSKTSYFFFHSQETWR